MSKTPKRKAQEVAEEENSDVFKRLKNDSVQDEEEDVSEDEESRETPKGHRKRKKQIYKNLVHLMEFYFGDANLSKSKFMKVRINTCSYYSS